MRLGARWHGPVRGQRGSGSTGAMRPLYRSNPMYDMVGPDRLDRLLLSPTVTAKRPIETMEWMWYVHTLTFTLSQPVLQHPTLGHTRGPCGRRYRGAT